MQPYAIKFHYVSEIAGKTGIHNYTLNLLLFIFMTKRLKHNYIKRGIPLKMYVLSVHIPRTGNRLEKESVDEAYRRASEFFKKKYNLKKIVFTCFSWMLYPKNLEILKPTSNIYKFISDYKIIDVKHYEDYSDVWRLFDMDYAGDPDALPADTSLRRAYIDIIKKGGKLGCGYGVYVYGKS